MKPRTIILLVLLTLNSNFGQSNLYITSNQNTSIVRMDSTNFKTPYNLKLERELAFLGTGVVTNLTGLIILNNVSPLTPEEISKLDINEINNFDRKGVKHYSDSKNGDYLLYGSFLLPLTFIADKNARRDWQILGIMWLEVLSIQTGINVIVKSLATRTRPYAYDQNAPLEIKESVEARLSFYSGHTATTAATSFFVARVFSEYLESDLARALIWSGAAIYPALTGYLRINTGNHFRTDVITGYLVGAAIGYFIPELHLRNKSMNVSFYNDFINDSFNLQLTYQF